MNETQKLQDIQVLRAVACLMVMFQHSSLGALIFSGLPGAMPFYLGVQLFFVISGYVVTNSMFRGEIRPIAFLIRRFFRLAPAIAAFLLFSYFVFIVSQPLPTAPALVEEFKAQAIAIMLGVLTLHHGGILSTFGHMWSLSIEYQFYFGVAVLALALVAARCEKRTIRSVFFITAVAFVVVSYAASIARIALPELGKYEPFVLTYLLNWNFYYLPLGVALALMPDRLRDYLWRLAPWRVPLSVAALLVALVAASASGSALEASTAPVRIGVMLPGVGLLFALVVVLSTVGSAERRHGRLYSLFVWLGDRSYSLYLFHLPVMVLISAMVTMFASWLWYINPLWFSLVQFVALFGMSVALAALCFATVEERGRMLGSYLARRRQPAASGQRCTVELWQAIPALSEPGRRSALTASDTSAVRPARPTAPSACGRG